MRESMFQSRHSRSIRSKRRTMLAVLAAGFLSIHGPASGAELNPCDLDGSGAVNSTDVQWAAEMSIGARTPCSANILGPGVCNVVVVQRVANAANGGTCTVDLSWVASTSPNVAYNVYRGTTLGGPYPTKLNLSPVAALTYRDGTVQGGVTYYYVVRAVDTGGTESVNSNEAVAATVAPSR